MLQQVKKKKSSFHTSTTVHSLLLVPPLFLPTATVRPLVTMMLLQHDGLMLTVSQDTHSSCHDSPSRPETL